MSVMDVDVGVSQVETVRPGGDASAQTDLDSNRIGTREGVVKTFEAFHVELDEHHDRRERLIKMSRDITSLSKKVIFLLHRLAAQSMSSAPSSSSSSSSFTFNHKSQQKLGSKSGSPDASDATSLKEASKLAFTHLTAIESLFRSMRIELRGGAFWRYQSSVSPGLQEYIEALAFAHYLNEGRLIGYEEVRKRLSDEEGEYFPLPLEEYLLGVSDLTGELMRFAITAIARRGGRQKANEVSDFVRHCKADFDGFTPYVKYLGKKQAVTAQSLLKIEDAAYAIAVRASEYAGSEDILEDIVERCVTGVRSKRYDAYDGGAGDFGSADQGYDDY